MMNDLAPARTIAIGDIHGCATALAALIEAVAPTNRDTLVPLGDYVDRGPDSRGALDQLVALARRCTLVPLLGNHEEMLLAARRDPGALQPWLLSGGVATLDSYGFGTGPAGLPAEHVAFIESCVSFHQTPTHFFVHATYRADMPLEDQPPLWLRWESLRDGLPEPHVSGKVAVVGHTPQPGGEILDLAHLKCIDTCCYGGGWLTALDAQSGRFWQANEQGEWRGGFLSSADKSADH